MHVFVVLAIAALIAAVSVVWRERHNWVHSASMTSLSLAAVLGWVNSNAAALSLLIGVVFGVINSWLKHRIAVAAEAGKLKASDAAKED